MLKIERTKFKKFKKMNTHHPILLLYLIMIILPINCYAKGCSTIWMDGKETAKCDGQGLISIPSGLSSSIHVLRLENNNKLQILPSKVFQERGLVNLQKIILMNCSLGMIVQDAFHQLNHLVELDLSLNLLIDVPSESFRNLNNVRRLLLRQNKIKSLHENNFASLTNLVHLDLSFNQIDSIEPGSFRGITLLKYLKLNNNRLTTLPSNVFVDIPPLFTMSLENNPWNCDCELRPLHRWISDNNMLLEPSLCKTPSKYENKAWNKMYIDDLACTPVLLSGDENSNYISGQIGSNATFRCQIKSSPRPEIDWSVKEPSADQMIPSINSNLNNNNQQPSPPYTLNTLSTPPNSQHQLSSNEESRFIISEPILELDDVVVSTFTLINLQPEDAQRKFICNAKNSAGLVQETFSINVYSASTGVLKSGSISWTLLMILFFIILICLIGLFIFTKRNKGKEENIKSNNNHNNHQNNHNNVNGGLSDNKLDVLKNVKNSLVGNHHIKTNVDDNQKLKTNNNTTNGGLYVNGGSTLKFNNSNLQLQQQPPSQFNNTSYSTMNNSELMTNNDLLINNSALVYGGIAAQQQSQCNPMDFTNNQLLANQYGTSAAFVQSPNLMNHSHLMSTPYQIATSTNTVGYLDNNINLNSSNEQLLNLTNNYCNYENMYGPLVNQQQPNAYATYGTATELQQMTTTVPMNVVDDMNMIAATNYHHLNNLNQLNQLSNLNQLNTLGKRNSPLISNSQDLSNLSSSIYQQQQQAALNQQLNHVNILGQGSYIAAQPTVVRYSPDDEGYSEETANSNFTLEGTEV